jgi:hypothetical protein
MKSFFAGKMVHQQSHVLEDGQVVTIAQVDGLLDGRDAGRHARTDTDEFFAKPFAVLAQADELLPEGF